MIVQEMIERSPVALRTTNENGRRAITFITGNIAAYGYKREDFLGENLAWADIIHAEDIDELRAAEETHDAEGIDEYSVIYRILRADGAPVWVHDNRHIIRDENKRVLHSDSIITDYTEIRENLEKIRENLNRQAVINDILQALHHSDTDKSLHIILDRTGKYLHVSRIVLLENSEDLKQGKAIREWYNESIAPSHAGGGGG
jgi:PAS domain S-box-containing protein